MILLAALIIIQGNTLAPMIYPPVPDLIDKIVECESGWNNNAVGKAGEIGLGQFLPKTWDWFNEIRKTNFDIYSHIDQLDMLYFGLYNGYRNHWTCFNKI